MSPSIFRVLWQLSRPKLCFWVLWVPFIGYGFSLWDHCADWTRPEALLQVLLAWWLLSAGTLWLNAALDGLDRQGALFARPLVPPPTASAFGYAALLAAVLLATWADCGAGVAAAACSLLAVLYSHPRTALKGHPLAGPAINALGYGCLSALAGFSVTGLELSPRARITYLLLTTWVLGASFAAQAFQQEDDARRGYRTLVATHGPVLVLRLARWLMTGSVGAVLLLSASGCYPRLFLLSTPVFALADRWVSRWQAQPRGGGSRWAAGAVTRYLRGGLLLFALAYADYFHSLAIGGPRAGLATTCRCEIGE